MEVALNVLRVSARDSALVLPNDGATADPESLCGAEGVEDGLKSPVHNFGVVQAFGGG